MTTRNATNYPGVVYRIAKRVGGKGKEKVYYVRYKKTGEKYEEKAGRQYADNMTPAKASHIRSELIEGKRLTRKEKRKAEQAHKEGRWTIGKLWDAYISTRAQGKAFDIDKGRYEKYLYDVFDNKEPKELNPMELNGFRIRLSKKLSPQTVKHILNLLTWIINYGVNNGYCGGAPFKIKKPSVDNKKTEFLTDEQLKNLLTVLGEYPNIQVVNMMRMALFTGIRRGGLLDLQWKNIDFERGFITIRNKGGNDETLPMNDMARAILEGHPRGKSEYVFPGKHGGKRSGSSKTARDIANKAGLPKNFRPLHGLRHHFASMLASSGEVDMYLIQKLMGHKDPRMTHRYAHLKDQAIKDASQVAGNIVTRAMKGKKEEQKTVNFKG